MVGSSPEHEVSDGTILRPDDDVKRASFSGSRFLFRGDDSYIEGPLGFELGSREAEEANIQRFEEHVQEKRTGETSRFVSFSIAKSGTAKFTEKNKVLKTTWDALLDLQKKHLIKIYTPEDVERLMKEHPKSKVKRRAQSVRQDMEKNGEVLIEGLIPAEILEWAK